MIDNMKNKKSMSLVEKEDFIKVLQIFLNNWYLFLLFPVFAGFIGYYVTYKMDSVYGAKTQVLLESNDTYNYQQQMYKNLGYYSVLNDVTNQKRVLTSYDMIAATVDKLDLEVSYFITGRIKTDELFNDVPFVVDVQQVSGEMYEMPISLKIVDTESYELTFVKGGEEHKAIHKFGQETLDPAYNVIVNLVIQLEEQSVKWVKDSNYSFKIHTRESLIYKYKSSVSVENVGYTSILDILVEDDLGERAKLFLDTLAATYVEYTLDAQVDVNVKTFEYISRQLEETIVILDDIEDELESFKEDHYIYDLSHEKSEYFVKMMKVEDEIEELILQLESIKELKNYIISTSDERFLPPSFYILKNDIYLAKSLGELYSYQMGRNGELGSMTERSMIITNVDNKIELLKKNILVYLKNTRIAIGAKQVELQRQHENYKKIIGAIPKTQRELLNIERKRQINEKMYMYLLEKRENTVIARAGIIPSTKIIEAPRSIGVIRPDKAKLLKTFILVGFAIAAIISIIKTIFFKRIESVKEMESITSIPIIGGVMKATDIEETELFVFSDPKSAIIESFRTIRTNLQYLNAGRKSKRILVTSLYPGEGKTFCSSSISSILAKSGKKVVLVDFDLHKPRAHKVFEMNNVFGVSNYLIRQRTVHEIIQDTKVEGLDTILAGPTPPNASELVLSAQVDRLLEELGEIYDHIILDTPPVSMISDAVSLLAKMDAGLFVMNTSHANNSGVAAVENVISKCGIESAGIILNGIKISKFKYYYGRYVGAYGYGYGYGYGHGYGTYGDGTKE